MRAIILIVAVAVLGAGVVAGSQAYQAHKRQIAFTRLIEDTCDSCTLRHKAQQKARELLRQQREAAEPEPGG